MKELASAIGNTPLLRLARMEQLWGLEGKLYAKAEFCNPGGSSKDRAAQRILSEAQESGLLQPGGTVIEATSGNMGISLAMLCAAGDCRCVIVMPAGMSKEREMLMRAYGAQVILTPAREGMEGALRHAQTLHRKISGSLLADQFRNIANVRAHYSSTGPEIWKDTRGQVDIFVAGVGTGGTVTGAGMFLKEKNAAIRVVAAEPAASPVLSGGAIGAHKIQGIGAGFIPEILDRSLVDAVLTIPDAQALETARLLAEKEGILAGISSGAAVWAAAQLARQQENREKTIVTILPDSGNRYLSCDLYP